MVKIKLLSNLAYICRKCIAYEQSLSPVHPDVDKRAFETRVRANETSEREREVSGKLLVIKKRLLRFFELHEQELF